jgi:hypothetical protein
MLKDSGGAGCADNAEDRPDRRGVIYVLFGGSGESMILCKSPGGADCNGPYVRAGK